MSFFSGFGGNDRPNNFYCPNEFTHTNSTFTQICDGLLHNDLSKIRSIMGKKGSMYTFKSIGRAPETDKNGNNLLHLAIIYECDEDILEFICIEADMLQQLVSHRNTSGETPYRMAVRLHNKTALIFFENRMESIKTLEKLKTTTEENLKLCTNIGRMSNEISNLKCDNNSLRRKITEQDDTIRTLKRYRDDSYELENCKRRRTEQDKEISELKSENTRLEKQVKTFMDASRRK